jgi:hypothetical protein
MIAGFEPVSHFFQAQITPQRMVINQAKIPSQIARASSYSRLNLLELVDSLKKKLK